MGRPWCARRQRRSCWRRLASLLATTTLLAGVAAPIAALADSANVAACCRGKCCCSGMKDGEGTCVRAVCPCRHSSGGAVFTGAPAHEALLWAAVTLSLPAPRRSPGPAFAACLLAGVAALPDPPPWPALHQPAIS